MNDYALRNNTRKQSTNDRFKLILNNIATNVKYHYLSNYGKYKNKEIQR